jgi:hypothetical protein
LPPNILAGQNLAGHKKKAKNIKNSGIDSFSQAGYDSEKTKIFPRQVQDL